MTSLSAEEAVGRDDPSPDWQLMPAEHAVALPPEAGALKWVLEGEAIGRIMQVYAENDAAAVVGQARYKRAGRLGLYAATAATIFGALFLLPVDVGPVRPYVSIIQIGGLVVAFLASRWLVAAKPFDVWMKRRAQAEIARVALFDKVARAPEGPRVAGQLLLLPLKLEYFRRYQLDVQRRYYRGRGAQHQAALWRNNKWLSASFFLTILSGVLGCAVVLLLAQQFGVTLPAWMTQALANVHMSYLNPTILALGVIASGCYGLGVARSLMDLDQRNAAKFATTAANLDYLTETGLAKARAAAAAGDEKAVLDFIDHVQQQISSEHKEWVILAGTEHNPDKLQYASVQE